MLLLRDGKDTAQRGTTEEKRARDTDANQGMLDMPQARGVEQSRQARNPAGRTAERGRAQASADGRKKAHDPPATRSEYGDSNEVACVT